MAFRFFLAFDDKAGHNFIGIGGNNKLDPTRKTAEGQEMDEKELIEIIEQATRDGRTQLNLPTKGITSLPAEIGNLKNLTSLDLGGNQIKSLPVEIGNLKNLTLLIMGGNQLNSLPAEIGNLKNLNLLHLSRNQLNSLPADIGNLKNLNSLYLSENKLNSLPSEIGNLTNLTSLTLRGNQLNSLPDEIGNLKNLTLLNLEGNQITSLPAEIVNLTNLTTLYLSRNKITSLPTEIINLTNLTSLDLGGNQITSLPTEIINLTKLTSLILAGNQLNSLPAEIGNLTNLSALYLGGNQFNSLPAEILNLTNLKSLNLAGNQLTSLQTEIINLTNLTSLDLGGNQINSLPDEIGNMKNLTSLNLEGNKLTSLPAEIVNLTNLTALYMSGNQIISLPTEIINLTNLTSLILAGNQVTSLPAKIGNLKNLTSLNLEGNQLTSLPAEIGNLTNMTTLYLGVNQITSLPTQLNNLKNLTVLDLSRNKITNVSALMGLRKLRRLDLHINQISNLPRQILDLGIEIRWRPTRRRELGIFLADNPLDKPPIEIVKQGTGAVRNYFVSIETEEVLRVYEAKLLIVGEGEVGKTCLTKRLLEPDKKIDVKDITTEGIEINQWTIETPKAKNFRVNFWDFGGQEIYHATHQFFLSKRSLYLFVWTARTDDDLTSFDYWLNIVRMLSDNSPVIVVLNKIDERIKSIDEQSLQDKFENIVCFDKVSAIEGTGIEGLISKIKQQITQLPHIGDVLPTVWIDIRKRLEGIDKHHISFNEYKAICSEFGLDEEKAEFLSRYYHDLGVFLHFLDNAVLRDIVFLKPDWATNAVYKVVDTKEIQESDGKFHFEQLKGIWSDYPEDKFAHLLELMKKFEICFQIPKTQIYIVTELLRPGRPKFDWDYTDNLRFEYRYEFMPAGIITRFIVRTHDICKEEIYWKNGVILEREDTEALVISERLNRKISIWIRGDNRKELLAIIRREIDYIHNTLNNPDVREMIPCICSECERSNNPYFHSYLDLIMAKQKEKSQIECKKSFDNVSIEKLLGDYERPEDKREMERRWREEDIHIEVNPRIEVSPTIEQKQVIEQRPPVESTKKRKWYKTWKVIWAIIAGIFLILGGIWTAIQIYEHFHNSESKPKTEQKQNENKAVEYEINEINPP